MAYFAFNTFAPIGAYFADLIRSRLQIPIGFALLSSIFVFLAEPSSFVLWIPEFTVIAAIIGYELLNRQLNFGHSLYSSKLKKRISAYQPFIKALQGNKGWPNDRLQTKSPAQDSNSILQCGKKVVADDGGKIQNITNVNQSPYLTKHMGMQGDGYSGNRRSNETLRSGDCLKALLRDGSAGDVEEYLDWVIADQGEIHASHLEQLTTFFSRIGEIVKAERWLLKLVEKCCADSNMSTINVFLSACSRSGDQVRITKWINMLPTIGVKLDIMCYNHILNACAQAADVTCAESWMERLKEVGLEPNVISFGSMIHACARSNSPESAIKWFEKLRDTGIQPNTICYNAVIDACAKVGDMNRVY